MSFYEFLGGAENSAEAEDPAECGDDEPGGRGWVAGRGRSQAAPPGSAGRNEGQNQWVSGEDNEGQCG